MNEVSELLNNLVQDGTFDSQGEFTVSLQEASRKLGLLQLPEPRAYILKLVQWAVRSQASRIDVDIKGSTVSVWHDGEMPDFRELSKAESLLTASGALGHLGIGLNSVLFLEPTAFRLEADGAYLQLHPEVKTGVSEKPAHPNGTAIIIEGLPKRLFEPSVLVRETASRYWDIVPRIFTVVPDASGFRRPEAALVRQRCLRANIPIYLNGKCILQPINCRFSKGSDVIRTDNGMRNQHLRFLLRKEVTPGAIPCPPHALGKQKTDWIGVGPGVIGERPIDSEELHRWPELSSLTFEGKPALAGHANYYRHATGRPGTISWLMDGIIVEETPLKRPIYIVADASDLKTDLSQFALVKDRHFRERFDWLMNWVPGY